MLLVHIPHSELQRSRSPRKEYHTQHWVYTEEERQKDSKQCTQAAKDQTLYCQKTTQSYLKVSETTMFMGWRPHHSVLQNSFYQQFQEKKQPCTKNFHSTQLILTLTDQGLRVSNQPWPVPSEEEPTTRVTRTYLLALLFSSGLHSS